ncbi:nucleotidyltransferase family protein [Kribbella monticola]|uniref:nucleotidyltransferase family protein n=1 Tax=Kribbella monticola TaxID=2185285 RepID=UPI000DD49AED|nr:nucleotidyltransferase family protein [Kribbella monticola]
MAAPGRAIVLAAGLGRRINGAEPGRPKCMLEVGGKPILEHIVAHLAGFGYQDITINTHHLPEVVETHFGSGAAFGVSLRYEFEPELLGTAGTVRRLAAGAGQPVLIWYGDNLSRVDLDAMMAVHRSRESQFTVAAHVREDCRDSGTVELDDGLVTSFREKDPAVRGPQLVNAGIYLADPAAIALLPDFTPCDFGIDVLPHFARWPAVRMAGYELSAAEGLWWSDRPIDLQRTRKTFTPGIPDGNRTRAIT